MDNFCDTILPYHNCEWTKILARYQRFWKSRFPWYTLNISQPGWYLVFCYDICTLDNADGPIWNSNWPISTHCGIHLLLIYISFWSWS